VHHDEIDAARGAVRLALRGATVGDD